jgi:hypothetical protein
MAQLSSVTIREIGVNNGVEHDVTEHVAVIPSVGAILLVGSGNTPDTYRVERIEHRLSTRGQYVTLWCIVLELEEPPA